MKKSIMGVLTLLWVCMIILGGCSSSKEKTFSFESPQKIIVTSISGEKIEVIDEDIIQQITDNITSIQFERGESSEDTNGFGPMISWYNSNGDVIETISVMGNDTIIYNSYFWKAINGSIDTEVINDILSTDGVADYPAAINGYTESYNILDYSEFFQGIDGCAVIYDESSNVYSVYSKEKCETEVSPLSTFKIISALAGLENNVLVNETSTMEYSGVKYPIDTWNSNLTLKEAFETSCVWYFRQVVDMVGQENIHTMLEEIQYGNCDISEWDGSAINPLPELNGFWLESSLKISPKQQVVALDYIFGRENNFNAENLEELKKIMYIAELDNGSLYGKTGSGIDGKAWFVGFMEENGNRIYFAVYLDDMQNKEIVSGNKAKEIAINILAQN